MRIGYEQKSATWEMAAAFLWSFRWREGGWFLSKLGEWILRYSTDVVSQKCLRDE